MAQRENRLLQRELFLISTGVRVVLALNVALALVIAPRARAMVDFSKDFQPLFAEHCLKCHGPEKQKGGLRLDVKASALKGGDSGEPAVVPSNSGKSKLIELISAAPDSDIRMPPKGEMLKPEQIALLKRWIEEGANWPESKSAETNAGPRELVVTDEDRKHWAFRPLSVGTRPTASEMKSGNPFLAKNGVDAFITAALHTNHLSLAPEASRRTLIRRLYFDLVGLPPTPEQVRAFEQDTSPQAYEKLVERLLASPHFGERWARHWLDVARYADSKGYERDGDRPTAWHYRDFVIRAFNEDMPFDQFVKWQLAGDELEPTNFAARIATAFIGLGPEVESDTKLADELARYRYADLDDMLSTTSQAMLGLTVGCARCHDHKYDPIPTRDYYRMLSAFTPLERHEMPLVSDAEWRAYLAATNAHAKQVGAAKKQLDEWLKSAKDAVRTNLLAYKRASLKPGDKEPKLSDDDFRKAFTLEQRAEWDRLAAALKKVEAAMPSAPLTALTMARMKSPPKNFLMKRGEPTHPGDEVELGFLTVLMRDKSVEQYRASGERTALANWMTDVEDGAGALLAGVIVNRLWQHHFGEGLVRTPSDFGVQGEPPSHPELLDWLASELVRNGWRLKPIHRVIVTSATYKQGSTEANEGNKERKGRASLPSFAAVHPQRLESEILRDSILAVSGCLNTNMFGPGVKAPIPAELNSAYNTRDPYPTDVKDTPETWRRSVYLFTKRSLRQPLLEVFDGADPSASCARRIPTTVAPQALAMLNDGWIRARARDFARRLETESGNSTEEQVKRAFQVALSRDATTREVERAVKFISAQAKARAQRGEKNAAQLALTDFCHAVFGLNEFVYVD
jgi:mono/diheme cytochrome c family protein